MTVTVQIQAFISQKRVTLPAIFVLFLMESLSNKASSFLVPLAWQGNMSGDVAWHCLAVVWPTDTLLGDSVILWTWTTCTRVLGVVLNSPSVQRLG
jgi:hypothetical protein